LKQVKFGIKLIEKLRRIKMWHLLLLNVVRRCRNWKVTLRSDPSEGFPRVKSRSSYNFFRNQSSLVWNSSENCDE